MAFHPSSMYLYNNRTELHWSTGCSRALALASANNSNNNNTNGRSSATGEQQIQLDQQRLASVLLLQQQQQQQAIQAAKNMLRQARTDSSNMDCASSSLDQRRPDQQAQQNHHHRPVQSPEGDSEDEQSILMDENDLSEDDIADDDINDDDDDDDDDVDDQTDHNEDEERLEVGECELQAAEMEAEQETALNLSLHSSDRKRDIDFSSNINQQFQDFKNNNHNQNQYLKHLSTENKSSFIAATAPLIQNSAQRLNNVNELKLQAQFNNRQSSQVMNQTSSRHNNHNHSTTTTATNGGNNSTSTHLNSFNSTGSSASSTSSSSSASSTSSSSSSSSYSSGWSSTAESLASCSPERATSISSPISTTTTTTASLINTYQRNLHLLPEAHRHQQQQQHQHHQQQQQQTNDHRPLFLNHHHHHHHELGPVQKTDSDDLDRIRNFIEQFKARRGSLGLTQKQAAQCFRAYTSDRYAFSDNFVGHFEGFQFRPQTAMTIADSLAEWLEFAENETRKGHQLSFMPGKVKETRKRKYEVIRIRDSAKRVLVEAFEKNKSPSTSELEQLSRKTNIPSRNIEIFFKNRRTSRQYHQ